MPMNELWGIQTLRTLTHTLRLRTLADYRHYIERLRTIMPYMDQTIALLRQGVKDGMTEPRVVMQGVPAQIAANIVSSPAASPFYAPFRNLPSLIPAAEQARLRAEAKAAIAQVVTPAYRKLQQYFDHDYLPHCRASIAAEALRMARPTTPTWYASTPPRT